MCLRRWHVVFHCRAWQCVCTHATYIHTYCVHVSKHRCAFHSMYAIRYGMVWYDLVLDWIRIRLRSNAVVHALYCTCPSDSGSGSGSYLFNFCSTQLYGISNIAVLFPCCFDGLDTQTRLRFALSLSILVWNQFKYIVCVMCVCFFRFFMFFFVYFSALWASLIVHFDKYKFDIRCAKCSAIKVYDRILLSACIASHTTQPASHNHQHER